ncbi:helix-turn-helix transcriptional regulator [Clostridium cellulovorans]|uniref:Regulatory protein DeoR n=1 Tax=Clostridium cellulovorans (strain ATCC 35296 / DSM 3052 / OCM 3 / 743B) TaxID=573061 RepID=D9SND7_CLOC7|nr:YafY family protein [Clostridium cellulovorans]ADL53929.1 regulatory protein DeoR [Clostridium cellulovorans 743B]
MKIDRLFSILLMIINKEKITAKELAEHYQVSVRTIQRDIDTLSMAGIPIYAESGKNGGYQLLEGYKLDMNFLNTKEAKIIRAILDNLEKIAPYLDMKTISNKFSSTHLLDNQDNKLIMKLNPLINEENLKKHLELIAKARDNYHKICMKYVDMNFQVTDRIICPYTLVMMGTVWYVYGYCELREDFRIFKLSRIIECIILNEEFVVKETPKPAPWDSNLDSSSENTKVVLEVDRILQGKIADYVDYKDCIIENDKIIVTLNFPIDEWLYSFIFGLVPYVKILEPTWLRVEFIKRLNLAMKKNIL